VAHIDPGDRSLGADSSRTIAGDEGVDKRQVARLVVAGVIAVAALVFIVQNSETVETTFLVFSGETRLWVGLLIAFVLGAVLGQLAQVLWRRRGDRDD
jgi:uncharacterized integral membrane protein